VVHDQVTHGIVRVGLVYNTLNCYCSLGLETVDERRLPVDTLPRRSLKRIDAQDLEKAVSSPNRFTYACYFL